MENKKINVATSTSKYYLFDKYDNNTNNKKIPYSLKYSKRIKSAYFNKNSQQIRNNIVNNKYHHLSDIYNNNYNYTNPIASHLHNNITSTFTNCETASNETKNIHRNNKRRIHSSYIKMSSDKLSNYKRLNSGIHKQKLITDINTDNHLLFNISNKCSFNIVRQNEVHSNIVLSHKRDKPIKVITYDDLSEIGDDAWILTDNNNDLLLCSFFVLFL